MMMMMMIMMMMMMMMSVNILICYMSFRVEFEYVVYYMSKINLNPILSV